MRIAFFSTKAYERRFFDAANANGAHELSYFETRLHADTVSLAHDHPAVCVFVNDEVDAAVLEALAAQNTRVVALRAAGFNNVDLRRADALGVTVVRVPAYSPHAVAEHTVGLMLTLIRRIHRAYARTREGNFGLDGLMGFDLHGRTVGVVGTGKIGEIVAQIMKGFGCRVLAHDPKPSAECEALGVSYEPLKTLFSESDIVTLHCPLVPDTYHLINAEAISRMKDGVTIINTSRGALIDTPAVIDGLKSGHIGHLALDVYEEEADIFFEDFSDRILQDDVFARLLTFPNVLITGHQAFFTREAMSAIAETTLQNLSDVEAGRACPNRVSAERIRR